MPKHDMSKMNDSNAAMPKPKTTPKPKAKPKSKAKPKPAKHVKGSEDAKA